MAQLFHSSAVIFWSRENRVPVRVYGTMFFKRQKEASLASAREIVPHISKLIHPKSVVDIGCGTGAWLSVFKENGVDDILGVDGDYVDRRILLIPQEQFVPFDLRKRLTIDRQFDLAVSLEVAEHLPPACAETFVESLTMLASVILFSAATPGQTKTGGVHLNEQWPAYWAEKFRRKGFVAVDCIRKLVWRNENVAWWYARNLLVFVKADALEDFPMLQAEHAVTNVSQISVVHPKLLLAWCDLENLPLRRLLWLLKKVLCRITIRMARKVIAKTVQWQGKT